MKLSAQVQAGARCRNAVAPFKNIHQSSGRRPRLVAKAATALDPDNTSILVAGGGGVALEVTRKLKDMGSWVWMMQRHEERRKTIEGWMAVVAKGDALNTADVEKVFNGIEDVDAVVSSLGGSVANPQVDSQGNINLIEAAVKRGVKKFILVTSLGCGSSKMACGQQVYDVLAPVLVEKDKAEQKLQSLKDKMTFVIIRPGGLTSDPASGAAILTESTEVCGSIARADVADLVVKCLFSSKSDNKILSAVDKHKVRTTAAYDVFVL